MSNWKLIDMITKETVLVCNDQIKAAIEEMRKTNERMLWHFKYGQAWEEQGDIELAQHEYSWSDELHEQIRGMVQMFRLLTGLEICEVNLLHDPFEKI